MNKDKIIKDLKERNEKLSNQYRLRDIRCVHLEMENTDLQQRIDKAIEYIKYNDDTLFTYEPDYDYEENLVDNYDVSSYREDLLEILGGKE